MIARDAVAVPPNRLLVENRLTPRGLTSTPISRESVGQVAWTTDMPGPIESRPRRVVVHAEHGIGAKAPAPCPQSYDSGALFVLVLTRSKSRPELVTQDIPFGRTTKMVQVPDSEAQSSM